MAGEAVVHRARRRARRAGNSEWLDRGARVGLAGRGLLYLIVAFLAASIALGREGQTADKQGAVQNLAGSPLGTFLLVGLVGGLTGLALWQAAEALWGRTQERNDTKRTAKRAASAVKAVLYLAIAATAVGLLGHVARGVVAGLAGLLLVKAALDFNPEEAKGVDGTLRTIAAQPYGKALLLLAAAGLAAFGLFSFVEARYRRL